MNKDDVLAKSRAENQGTDEYEKYVLEKAGNLSAQTGMTICCIIAVTSLLVTGRANNGCWVVYFSIQAVIFWTKYRHLRKKHELILAVTATALGLMCTGVFIAADLMGL